MTKKRFLQFVVKETKKLQGCGCRRSIPGEEPY